MHRRQLLRFTLAATLAGLLPAGCGRNGISPAATPQEAGTATSGGADGLRVLIVGAGMAGIAAARELTAAGHQPLLLEARERIGGRIWTSHAWPDIPLDLGGSWIHGVEDNPITALAKEFGVPTIETDYDNIVVFDTTGRGLTDDTLDLLYALLERLLADLDDARLAMDERGDDDIALGVAVEEWLDGQQLSASDLYGLAWAINTEIEHEYAADVSDLSLFSFDDSGSFDGPDVLFPDGYGALVDQLAAVLDVRLGQEVTRIEHSDDGVRVTTAGGETWEADHAIVTVPLGVLQRDAISFVPPLPDSHQRAIRRLGMGLLNKIYLRFGSVFWPEEPDLIGYASEQTGYFASWLNMAHYTGAPVLLGFNAADFGREIEGWSDERIVADAMTALRSMFGDEIPEPESWQITRWANDPYAGGSYSYLPVDVSGDEYDELAQPVGARLHFAGEATNSEFPATVHGAWLSGQRAANEILAP